MKIGILKTLLIAALLALSASTAPAQSSSTNYAWANGGFSSYDLDGTFSRHTLALFVPDGASTVNITSSYLESGCNSNTVITYTLQAGRALEVGEAIQFGYPSAWPGIATILELGTDAQGNATATTSQITCFAHPVAGTASAGPALGWHLYFDGPNGTGPAAGERCDAGQSAVTAGFFDESGALQSAQSASSTVACSLSTPDGGYTLVAAGAFSGTASNGQAFTATFSVTQRRGRYGWYAQTAQWTVQVSEAVIQ